MRVPAFVLLLAAVLLAGCGGSGRSAKANGEASKPADRVLADAKAAATGASSVHISGDVVADGTPITLDLDLVRGKGAKGSMSTSGLRFELIRIGDTAYIRGSDAFLRQFAGAAIAQLIHGKWLKASTLQGRFRSLVPLTSVAALFAVVGSGHGKLVHAGETTYAGEQVVAIRDTSDESKLYVAATGTPYPVAVVSRKQGESGAVAFSRWNASVSLSAPQNAIDISRVTGG